MPHIVQRGGPAQRGPVAAPLLQGIDALARRFRGAVGQRHRLFRRQAARFLERRPRRRWPRRRSGCSRHPEVVVRVEGYGDPLDTRDHALAVGARARQDVRDYLVLLGVPAAQLSAASFGKERPGLGRAVTVLVR